MRCENRVETCKESITQHKNLHGSPLGLRLQS